MRLGVGGGIVRGGWRGEVDGAGWLEWYRCLRVIFSWGFWEVGESLSRLLLKRFRLVLVLFFNFIRGHAVL